MIKIVNLKKSFGKQVVLKGVNLEIPEGSLTFIMGRSGTGKSVLLKLIIGLLKPDDGEIWIKGKNVVSLSKKELREIRKSVGYLFQEGALFDFLTVEENVAFPLKEHLKLNKKEIKERVEFLLSAVGLLEARHKYPSELSGGMKKRAALARAIALNPEIILFDEPTTGLDPILQNDILALIKSLKERFGLTCVIVSHDVHLMLKYAEFVGFLHEGEILEMGPLEEIKKSEKEFIKKFIASGLAQI